MPDSTKIEIALIRAEGCPGLEDGEGQIEDAARPGVGAPPQTNLPFKVPVELRNPERQQ